MRIHSEGNRVRSVLLDTERPVFRIVLPGGIGTVEIETGLSTEDGKPRVRVDVESDTFRFGPASDGRSYVVENGDPGVVFLTGQFID